MDLFKQNVDPSEFVQTIPDLLIHEISKEPSPFEHDKTSHKIPLKFKNPDVRKAIIFYCFYY